VIAAPMPKPLLKQPLLKQPLDDAIAHADEARVFRLAPELRALFGEPFAPSPPARSPAGRAPLRTRAERRRAQRTERRRWQRREGRDRVSYETTRAVDYTLGDRQADVFEAGETYRFRVLIAGRRFGKTYLACVELLIAATSRAKSLCWYVAPTYRMAKDIAWDTLKELIPPELLAGKPNESTLTIRLVNGSRIQLKGAEHPNRLKGRSLWFVVLDEFAQMVVKVWQEAIRPSLADLRGSALFISTPMGFNWAYDLFQDGQDAIKVDWISFQFTTIDGGRVTPDEIAEAQAILDARVFRQEFLASFETLAGRVYDAFARAVHVAATTADLALVDDPGNGDVLVGMDFNVNPMTAVLAWMYREPNTQRLWCHIFDVIELMASNTEEMAAELERRYPRSLPADKAPRRLVICPDPSGNARKTSAPAGQTDFTILERHGFLVRAESKAPLVVDRINNTQANLRDAAGKPHLRVHPRCKSLIKAWEGLTYKEGTNQPDKASGLDHVCDATDYLLWELFNRLNAYRIGFSKHRV
jgi:hypothetical protein